MDRYLAHGITRAHLGRLAYQLGGRLVLFRPYRKTRQDLGLAGLPYPDPRGRRPADTMDPAGPWRAAALARRQQRYISARRAGVGGDLVHVVGANSSRAFLVERNHAQERPSGHRHRPLWTGSPSDLYRAYRGYAGNGYCGWDRYSAARHSADRFRALAEGAHGRGLSDHGAGRGSLRTLLSPRANAGSVSANALD